MRVDRRLSCFDFDLSKIGVFSNFSLIGYSGFRHDYPTVGTAQTVGSCLSGTSLSNWNI